MKKLYQALSILCCLSLAACGTIGLTSIDYLVPADVSFPSQIKKVGVVNNVSDFVGDRSNVKDTVLGASGIASIIYSYGEADKATESLAQTISDGNYFDEVLISDSVLRAGDKHPRETTLSQREVQELSKSMGVDMIVSFENLIISFEHVLHFIPEWGEYSGTIDAVAYPTVKLYIPSRNGPLVTINTKDSIFWDDTLMPERQPRSSAIEDKLVKEASEFAGTIPVKHIIPYWDTADRYYYDGGSVDMRDAGIFVRENSWDKAFELWSKVFENSKNKKKMRAAFNIALYYEIKDDLENAEVWINKALEMARQIDKIDSTGSEKEISPLQTKTSNYALAYFYSKKLVERKEARSKLNMQMDRFADE